MAIKKHKKLPLYEARLAEDGGIVCVSLVESPAVESSFQAYDETKPVRTYAVADDEKRRVFGVLMRADHPMLRRDEDGREYYVVFRAEQIRAFAQKYLADGFQNNVDTHHDFAFVEGCEMVQYFIKDSARGINPQGFADIADGSLFAEYQVTSDELWERIKSGEFSGFSIAVVEKDVPVMEDNYSSIDNMGKIEKIKAALAAFVKAAEDYTATLSEYGRVATDKGTLVWDGDEEIAEGKTVWTEDADGNRVDLEDGEYTTDNKRVIVLEGGIVKEIRDVVEEIPADEAPAPASEPETMAEEPAAEEAPAAEPDEKDARIAELEAENAELKAKIAELEKKLAEPAGDTAHETFKKVGKVDENPFDIYRKYAR